MWGMDDRFSIIVTVLGILGETAVVFLIAHRLLGHYPPKRWLMACTAIALFIAVLIVGAVLQFVAEVEQHGHDALIFFPILLLIEGACLLGVLAAVSFAAFGILALVRWLNRNDDPNRQPSRPESRDPA